MIWATSYEYYQTTAVVLVSWDLATTILLIRVASTRQCAAQMRDRTKLVVSIVDSDSSLKIVVVCVPTWVQCDDSHVNVTV